MQDERRGLDVRTTTPPLTPTANGKVENVEDGGGGGDGGENGTSGSVEYTLKPATRPYASTARLNLQHYLWKDQTGFLLHPSIQLDTSRTDLKIADVGTGTGIWLLDLARTLPPTAQLDGFDIDIADCPADEWLPANVTMRRLDALGEMPAELAGAYDVVQVRLFQVVVRDNDPGPLLRNVVGMLKPTGYLQWAEYDPTTLTTHRTHPPTTHPTPSLDAIPPFIQSLQTTHDARLGFHAWIPLLPSLFAAHPFLALVAADRYPTQEAYLRVQLDVFLLTYEELAAKTVGRWGGGRGERLRGLVEGAGGEGRRGVGWGVERLVVVGRRRGVGGEGNGRVGVGGIAGVGVGDGGEKGEKGEKGWGREKRVSGRERWSRVWKRLSGSL